jgi:hypothetical protein
VQIVKKNQPAILIPKPRNLKPSKQRGEKGKRGIFLLAWLQEELGGGEISILSLKAKSATLSHDFHNIPPEKNLTNMVFL